MRLPLCCAWTRSSCWVTALLSSQARLPPAGTRLGSDHTHNTRKLMLRACSKQPRCQVWPEGFFGTPWAPQAREAMAGKEPPCPSAAPPAPAKQCCLPVCWQKAKSGEERTADFKRQRIKRHKGRQINQLMCLWAKKPGCLGESRQVKAQRPPLP